MRLALAQIEAGPEQSENLDTATTYVREAATRGADLVVLPEIWNVGYFAFDAYASGAEPLEGPTATRMGELAAELDVYLHAGSIVETDGEDLYNTSLLFGPDGDLLGTYRKIHLFGYESEEARLLTPGDRITTLDTPLGTLGMTTCYDLRFPDLYRALCDAGVELVLVASAWPAERLDHWRLFTRTRAVEQQLFVAAANLTGETRGVDLAGHSLVADPWGVVRVNAGTDEGVTLATVDLETVASVREAFPAVSDRRRDVAFETDGRSDG